MFVLKKIISRLLFPVPLCIGLLILGMLLEFWLRHKRMGRGLMIAATVVLLLLSSQPVAQRLVNGFERQYPPLGTLHELPSDAQDVDFVVVLTGGAPVREDTPITRQMDSHALTRLVEGVRVYNLCHDAKLVLSGGYGTAHDVPDEQLSNLHLVTQLGVPADDVIIVNTSRDTAEEALHLAPLLGSKPFVLVASASHMPRAVMLFEAEGLQPIPAPTDFFVGQQRLAIVEDAMPGAGYLYQSERAIYEALGTLWARMRGLKRVVPQP